MNKEKESIFNKFTPYMGNKKAYIPIASIFSAISAIINIIPFYYIWKIVNILLTTNNEISTKNTITYAWYIFIYSILGIFIYLFALLLSHLAAFEVELGIKKTGFEKTMNMPLGFFNKYSSGQIRKIINDGAENTHSFLAHQLPDLAGTMITPVILIIMLFIFDWRLGLACLIPIILSFIIMSTMMTKQGMEFQKQYQEKLEEMSAESVEYVRAIPVVKTFGQSVKSFTRFYNSIQNYRDLVIVYTKLWTIPYSLYSILGETTAFFLIPLAILLIGRGNDITGIISSFILYILIAPFFGMVMMKNALFIRKKNDAIRSIDKFNDLFNYKDMEYVKNDEKFVAQDIEFKNVTFSYDGKQKALDNINLKVEKGKTLALVGASGSGKTTIARLCARFWDADFGEILIGGKNIKDYSKETLMNNISFVFQNNKLFKTSLLENITFGKKDVSTKRIENALIKSGAKEVIDSLENGLNTIIGTKGTYLSGGEQQRIALARAFLKDAPIILLDEATAFADPENEHLIQNALIELSKGKTTIMIAHRMTTVRYADNIAIIDSGKVAEYGTHDELMNKNGLYKKMWDEYQKTIGWNIKKGM
ncbi:ABC transporter ATP-binding protein [Oceanivirga salmonicida]|uniref:ABC transporter ATP-binding protein n=1 Tax=Oceanivirga salmonicida TaxID=1769291 RepID=UPI0012E2E0C0|nr:ABC transporter ATP-binding protein [Oceanivirga salmonicida]